MSSSRSILHLDLDAFFCAVEEIRNPELRGKAFAVGGDPGGRGVVSSCSYPARKYGVHSAMPTARALKLCPGLMVVRGDHSRYGFYSRKVMGLLREVIDQVEKLSIDEAFLDITELKQPPRAIGLHIQKKILTQLQLPNSVGLATNKLVAKIANDVGKSSQGSESPPNALTVVPPGEEAKFLAPLPVDMLWGVGPKTRDRLEALGVQTIGDLAHYPALELAERFGKHGYSLSRRARGIDDRPVVTERESKSVSKERTFRRDQGRRQDILREMSRLAHQVSQRLVKKELKGRTIQIKVRWSDFDTHTRQTTLNHPVQDPETIASQARELFDELWEGHQQVRLIGVGVSNLDNHPQQMRLWDPEVKKDLKIQETLRTLQEKYGENAITQGIREKD